MDKKQIKINGKIAVEIKINGGLFWKAGVPVGDWKLDEGGYIIGEDGKYYERWFDDSQQIDNNPIADLNGEWVEDSVSGGLNIDKNFDYFMSNSNYHVSNSYSQFKVSWSGLTHVDFLYRSYGESCCDYLVINGLDKDKFTSRPSTSTSGILAHTQSKAATTYNTLSIDCDEGEHFIWFCYSKDGSVDSNSDRAFVGIPNIYKEGEIFEKQGKELHYEYVKSIDVVITREGFGKFKYYKIYYTPDNETSIKTDNFILGEEMPLTPITENYLRFDATTNDVHIGWTKLASVTDFEYAIDYDETWASFPDEGVDIPIGHSMYLRGNGIGNTTTAGQRFTTSDKVECHGDIRSLIKKTNFKNISSLSLYNNAFRYYFYNTDITTAPELHATSLANNCYEYMFRDCTSLTSAPATLPATTLSNYGYQGMFQGCTSLTSAPELPATSLRQNCYSNMFNGCTSLTTAPELPSILLANNCYKYMFNGCTSLTSAPATLPATAITVGSYYGMFRDCTSLTSAPATLPSTSLASECYREMFYGCTSLTSAPELPATTLAEGCYEAMFQTCQSLTSAPQLTATTLSKNCYKNMFYGCTSLTSAPELPATSMIDSCYKGMFQRCTSLTTAPELPATTLAEGCYDYMFEYCTSLNEVKCMAMYHSGDEITSYISSGFLKNVSSNGTFYKNPEWDGPTTRGQDTIPTGWTIVDWTDAA